MPRLSCLTATSGRHGCMRRLVAMMMAQDFKDFEWIVLNNSVVPLQWDWPGVRIINGESYPTLGHCRNRLLELARGELLRIIDDDDLYAPWDLRTGVERIGASLAWKPARSWWYDGSGMGSGVAREPCFELAANAMEASITWRTDWVRQAGGWRAGQGDESKDLLARLGGDLATDELGQWTPYCYLWGVGQFHAGQTLHNNQYTAEQRSADWQQRNRDDRPGTLLVPDSAGARAWWKKLVRYVAPDLQTAWLRAALGGGPAFAPPAIGHGGRKLHGRIVVAPGCWDALHPGHVWTLRWARAQGDSLVVLVNDDAGVESQKGSGRPLVPLAGRVAALAALDCVDGVRVVEGVDDLPALEKLKPQILVKGSEYAGVAEFRIPRPAGCTVLIAPPSPHVGHTSDLVAEPSASPPDVASRASVEAFPISYGGYDALPAPIVQAAPAPANCEHVQFQATNHIERSEDGRQWTLRTSVRCVQCGEPFRFIGLPVGANAFGAACSQDAVEGRFAIRPRLKE